MIEYYKGTGVPKSVNIDAVDRMAQSDPEYYRPEKGLKAAVNAAIILGQPLLVTGEPGTGKTDLGRAVAHELDLGPAELFSCKSNAQARDILYVYDALARFQAAQSRAPGEPLADTRDFIRFQALGLAILRAHPFAAVKSLMKNEQQHGGQKRTVLIVDEIDKAPRDFPNDLLHEFDKLQFTAPELPGAPETPASIDARFRPIVIITSNSERALPDAFLRRCVYYNIEFNPDSLLDIVPLRLGEQWKNKPLLLDLLAAFKLLRDPATGLDKKPGTAEFLNWLQYFAKNGAGAGDRLRQHVDLLRASLVTVLKHKRDLQTWSDQAEELANARR